MPCIPRLSAGCCATRARGKKPRWKHQPQRSLRCIRRLPLCKLLVTLLPMPKSLRLVLPLVLASASLCFAQSKPELRVGFAQAEIAQNGIPLAGYGSGARRTFPFIHGDEYATWFKPSTGTHDPIRVKAMVLWSGDKKLLFISLDVAAVTNEMYEDLVAHWAKLGYSQEAVFISATHTHSGPGTLSNRFLWEALAGDRFQPAYYARVC